MGGVAVVYEVYLLLLLGFLPALVARARPRPRSRSSFTFAFACFFGFFFGRGSAGAAEEEDELDGAPAGPEELDEEPEDRRGVEGELG